MYSSADIEHLFYNPMYIEDRDDWVWNDSYILYNHSEGYIMAYHKAYEEKELYVHPDTEQRVTNYIDMYDGF